MLKTLVQHRSLQIVFIIALYLTIAPFLPLEVHRFFYTTSLLIKELLLWMLPVTVAFFIAYAAASFKKHAPLFLLSLFLFEAISNALSVWFAYGWGHLTIQYLPPIARHEIHEGFTPLFSLPLLRPAFWSASKGTLIGLCFGLMCTFKFPTLNDIIKKGKGVVERVLTRVFARLIPLFVLGFVAKMYKTHLLEQTCTHSLEFVLCLSLGLLIYQLFLFFLGSGQEAFKSIKNLLPAAGVAFSSGCSLSTMPLTIEGTSKNLKNPSLAQAVIPASTNIQQIGDCITNGFLCFLIYSHFNGSPPSLWTWSCFTIPFVIARFATAAVLGGAIFIMLPIYESYLGFTPEMTTIILAFNVILDPLVTCSNVVANGALCRLFEKVWLSIQAFIDRKDQKTELN